MSQVTQSPFLQALGYAIVNSLWQFALLWLIYVSVNTILKLSSHKKYLVGLLIQFGGFTWFAVTFSLYFQQFLHFEKIDFLQQKTTTLGFADNNSIAIDDKLVAGILQTENFLPYLSVAYLLILFVLGLKWIRLYHLTQTIKTKGLQKIDVKWRLFVKQLSSQLSIKREVQIFLSEMVQTPLTIGFIKPIILIPLASLNNLNTYQMEAIILHEVAHIKRFDYVFNLFLALIDITLFFNPFAVLITKHLKRERENCCDDWVLQYDYNPASYATALLQIATNQSSPLLSLQASGNKDMLLNRIKRIIEKKEKTFFNYRYQLMALLVMLTVATSLALLSSSHKIKKAGISSLQGPIIVAPMDFFIAIEPEKDIKDNQRVVNNKRIKSTNFKTHPLQASRIIVVRDTKTVKQKTFNRVSRTKEKPEVPTRPTEPLVPRYRDEPLTEELVKNIEILNTGLETPVAFRNEQLDELEEQFKRLAIHLFEENKGTIYQKEVLAEIKAALAQISKVKIRSELAKQKTNEGKNEFRINSGVSQPYINKLKCGTITKEQQLKTEEFRKETERAIEAFLRNDNHNRARKLIYHLPSLEKSHSFSFEFSAEPKVRVVNPSFFYVPDRVKKTGKTTSKEDKRANRKNTFSPAFPWSIEKDSKADDNFIIIRI